MGIVMFDKIKYAQKLCELANIVYPSKDDFINRDLYLTVSHDNYTTPSSAIIAFNGSPPRLETYFRLENREIIIVGNKVIRFSQSYGRAVKLHQFLLDTFDNMVMLPNQRVP